MALWIFLAPSMELNRLFSVYWVLSVLCVSITSKPLQQVSCSQTPIPLILHTDYPVIWENSSNYYYYYFYYFVIFHWSKFNTIESPFFTFISSTWMRFDLSEGNHIQMDLKFVNLIKVFRQLRVTRSRFASSDVLWLQCMEYSMTYLPYSIHDLGHDFMLIFASKVKNFTEITLRRTWRATKTKI